MTRFQWCIAWAGPSVVAYTAGCGIACMNGAAFSPWHPWWMVTVVAAFSSLVAFTWNEFTPAQKPTKPATTEEQAILDELRRVKR